MNLIPSRVNEKGSTFLLRNHGRLLHVEVYGQHELDFYRLTHVVTTSGCVQGCWISST